MFLVCSAVIDLPGGPGCYSQVDRLSRDVAAAGARRFEPRPSGPDGHGVVPTPAGPGAAVEEELAHHLGPGLSASGSSVAVASRP